MVKKTAKCSGCGAAVKMEVCAEEKAEEADAKCIQCEIEAKMEKMMAPQSGVMDRIAELENALAKEREKTQAMGERLRLAEEELAMVVKNICDFSDAATALIGNLSDAELWHRGYARDNVDFKVFIDDCLRGPSWKVDRACCAKASK
ncbi:hypothetical protein HPB50_007326 [Hyalomma asiaticum]|uniref:Uncharacterized protein n=1 Tax=Hyalomma asiaticum TaxID=266040 RepID=A0ACB7TG63_HYAAI|nr:hypothetical protein HPB50_007326 [Hyalomma asiaticum]